MRAILIEIGLVLAVALGIAVGYMLWRTPTNWYAAVPDVAKLGPGAENDLIRYGKELIVNTPRLRLQPFTAEGEGARAGAEGAL